MGIGTGLSLATVLPGTRAVAGDATAKSSTCSRSRDEQGHVTLDEEA